MNNNENIDINSVVAAHKTRLDDALTRSEIICLIKIMGLELEGVEQTVKKELNANNKKGDTEIEVEFSDIIQKVSKLFAKYLQENDLVYGSEQRQKSDGTYELVVVLSKIVKEASVDLSTSFQIDTSGEVVIKDIK